jgi:hypothetical protein
MKIKCLITDIELRQDKNGKDYWIISTELDEHTSRKYLAFSADYKISPETVSLLENYPHQLVNKMVILTIRAGKKEGDLDKVINLDLEK